MDLLEAATIRILVLPVPPITKELYERHLHVLRTRTAVPFDRITISEPSLGQGLYIIQLNKR
jgi:hypothetical protein